MSGTSMATPHVAAVAAMYKLDNPSLTPIEIQNKIKENVLDLGTTGKDIYYGYGVPKLSLAIPDIPLESITLSKTKKTIFNKEEFELKVSYKPTHTTEPKDITWSTSDSTVAKVSNDKVTAVGVGKVIITAKVGDKTATCIVTVEQAPIINIPDENLKKAINLELGNEEKSDITIVDLNKLIKIKATGSNNSNLEGLQYAKNLEDISLSNNNIKDISVLDLSNKHNLRYLVLDNNKISDLSAFSNINFEKLYGLYLQNNNISDIRPLSTAKFPNLVNVFITNQEIELDSIEIEEGQSVEVNNPIKDENGKIVTNVTVTNGKYGKQFSGNVFVHTLVDEEIIEIPDINLKKELNKILYKDEGVDITKAELKSISYLYLSNKNISNLEGLQYATNI